MADLSVTYMGLKLKNPVILSSGPLSDTVERCKAAADAGVSAITLKSIMDRGAGETRWKHSVGRFRVVNRLNPFQRWDPKQGLDNMGLIIWGEGGSVWKEEKYGWFINEVKQAVGKDVKVGASILGSARRPDAWNEYVDICKNSDADYVEFDFGYERYYWFPENMERVIKKAKQVLSVPLGVKMTPCVEYPYQWAKRFQDWGVDGLCMFDGGGIGGGTGLDFDIDTLSFPHFQGVWTFLINGGNPVSGVNKSIAESRMLSGVTIGISASWGISKWQDVVKCIMSGADAVQVHTKFMLRGFKEASEWLKAMNNWLDEKNYKSISELKGRILDGVVVPLSDKDVPREVPPEVGGIPSLKCVVDQAKCRGCLDLCTRACMFFAISEVGNKANIDESKCGACGMCVGICPAEALSLQPRTPEDKEEFDSYLRRTGKTEAGTGGKQIG